MLRPLRDNVIIQKEVVFTEDKSQGGILLPTDKNARGLQIQGWDKGLNDWGRVLRVGGAVKEIKVGDRVLYTRLLAHKLIEEEEGKRVIVMAKEDIIHLVDEGES